MHYFQAIASMKVWHSRLAGATIITLISKTGNYDRSKRAGSPGEKEQQSAASPKKPSLQRPEG
jgi:hypothetical protein